MKFLNKKTLVVVFVLALIVAGLYFFVFKPEPELRQIEESSPAESSDTQNENSSEEQTGSISDEVDESVKQSQPVQDSVSEPPLVYTGYGHVQDDPLLKTQETSTTCTTASKVDCTITFTNASGNKVQLPVKTTDSQGIAVWNWIGQDVGSGTWKVTASAGDKVSSEEVIYIE